MKNDIADILFKYTTGEATLEETNDALKEAEAGFNLEPGRNEITPDEMALTTVGDTPEEANGFGLLDTGTGSMEKVHVTNGKLDEAINQVNHDGTTNMGHAGRFVQGANEGRAGGHPAPGEQVHRSQVQGSQRSHLSGWHPPSCGVDVPLQELRPEGLGQLR